MFPKNIYVYSGYTHLTYFEQDATIYNADWEPPIQL